MLNAFLAAGLDHLAGNPQSGDAAQRVLSKQDFDAAIAEISAQMHVAPDFGVTPAEPKVMPVHNVIQG